MGYILKFAVFLLSAYYTYSDDCKLSKVALVLDRSWSVIDADWLLVKEYAKYLIDKTKISPTGSSAGVVTFALSANIAAHCDVHSTSASLNLAIDNFDRNNYDNTDTNIKDGLIKANQVLSNCIVGSQANEIVVVITDGMSTIGGSPKGFAQSMRNNGVEIFAIGVGNKPSESELLGIAGSAENTLLVSSFDELMKSTVFNEKLTSMLCQTKRTTTTTEFPTTTTTTEDPTTTTTTEASTTTTTTEASTTTTTTEEPTTTTTEAPTTTATTTTTKASTTKGPLVCNCTTNEEHICLSWGKLDINFYFKGLCYEERLKQAVRYVEAKKKYIEDKNASILSCLPNIRDAIVEQGTVSLLQQYNKCILAVYCTNKEHLRRLNLKLEQLAREVKREERKQNMGIIGSFINNFKREDSFLTSLSSW